MRNQNSLLTLLLRGTAAQPTHFKEMLSQSRAQTGHQWTKGVRSNTYYNKLRASNNALGMFRTKHRWRNILHASKTVIGIPTVLGETTCLWYHTKRTTHGITIMSLLITSHVLETPGLPRPSIRAISYSIIRCTPSKNHLASCAMSTYVWRQQRKPIHLCICKQYGFACVELAGL